MSAAEYVIYGLSILILLAVGLILLKKRSRYPDTRTGYHVKEAMISSQTWNQANSIAGRLCLMGGAMFAGEGLLWIFVPANLTLRLMLFLALWAVEIPCIIYLPAKWLKRCENRQNHG